MSTPALPSRSAYYLVQSDGSVSTYGGAVPYDPKAIGGSKVIAAPTMAHGSNGYWLVTAQGNVFNFGCAAFYGSPVHVRLPTPIAAAAAMPSGNGYWLVTKRGNLFHFGSAQFAGSPVHRHLKYPVVAMASTPDGGGYWIATSDGRVFSYGDAEKLGSLRAPRRPVVALVPVPTGSGYWLVTADGGVHNFGTAGFFGSSVHAKLPRPIISASAMPDGKGYFLLGSSGRVYNFGDAGFAGSLAHSPLARSIRTVALVATAPPPPPPPPPPPSPVPATPPGSAATLTAAPSAVSLPNGEIGYDISNYQCASSGSAAASASLPTTAAFAIIEASGWLDNSFNSCLQAQANWATGAAGPGGTPYELYVFLNSPSTSSGAATQSSTGPAGTCSGPQTASQQACAAYNYGYNGAQLSYSHASSLGVSSGTWWVDVENASLSPNGYSNPSAGQYWSNSTALNDQTIQGAIDALRAQGVTVGIYSTSLQFPAIAGSSFVPSGPPVPLWIAGVPWTNPPFTESGLPSQSVLATWCGGTASYSGSSGTDLFAGGVPRILQETPGSEPSPYGIDPDYSC